ncbi:MAG: helix-turn-helix transcriptional regulator [Alphaproteobacteria bacterium]|nr:helix-turn-helix transcriptional regulator [Alphaproteobacteria bacterium]
MGIKSALLKKQIDTSNVYTPNFLPFNPEVFLSIQNIIFKFKDINGYNSLKKISLCIEGNYYSFSYREMQCLIPTIKGKTSKEIARLLNLSPRSVEKYIDNVKNKMKCKGRGEMIEKIFRCYEFHFFLFSEAFSKDKISFREKI